MHTDTCLADRLIDSDAYLGRHRRELVRRKRERVLDKYTDLRHLAAGHEHFGLHRTAAGWVFREWASNASAIYLLGDFCGWQADSAYALSRVGDHGQWELHVADNVLRHGDLFRHRSRHGGWTRAHRQPIVSLFAGPLGCGAATHQC